MTRENKLALVIGFGLMLFVGILVSDHFSAQRFDPVSVAQKDPAPEPGAPTKLDEVAPGTLVAGNNPVDLTGQGTSVLPEAPAGGEAPPVDGNPVDVHVADTGPGLDGETLQNLFDRYWHARKKAEGSDTGRGLGLGLSICKGIVEAHHGRIWATTAPKRGTAIHFTLSAV